MAIDHRSHFTKGTKFIAGTDEPLKYPKSKAIERDSILERGKGYPQYSSACDAVTRIKPGKLCFLIE